MLIQKESLLGILLVMEVLIVNCFLYGKSCSKKQYSVIKEMMYIKKFVMENTLVIFRIKANLSSI